MTPRQRTMKDVEAVARIYRIDMVELMGHSRRNTAVKARQAVMWMLRYSKAWSFPAIGRFMNRDHSTVVFGIGRHEIRMGLRSPLAVQVSIRLERTRRWHDAHRAERERKVAA